MYNVGDYGADSADPENYVPEHGSGYKFHFRYSAGVNNTASASQFKLCKVGEIAAMVAAGEDPVANFEASEGRPAQGAAAGAADGAADLIFWQSRGLAKGSTIYISWEPGTDQIAWPAVVAFYQAYNAALQGYYFADGGYEGLQTLIHLAQVGVIKHAWLPGAASTVVPKIKIDDAYAPPAHYNWDLWFPTKMQVGPAIRYLQTLIPPGLFESVIWQDGNQLDSHTADEDIVVIGGPIGSHLEALGGVTPTPPPPVPVPPAPPAPPKPVVKAWQGYPVPALIANEHDYLGSISGPAISHGGATQAEKNIIKVLQQRLIACGFVPGVIDVNSSWADGVFDAPHETPGTGATSLAVQRFHDAWYQHQPKPRIIMADDWRVLFNHA